MYLNFYTLVLKYSDTCLAICTKVDSFLRTSYMLFLGMKTKRLQEKGIYTRKTLKQRLSFHWSVLYNVYYGIHIQPSSEKPDPHVLQNVDHEDILLNIAL